MASQATRQRVGIRVRGPVLDHPVAQGVEIVGWTDMDGKPDGLQMQYQEVDGRHYLYVGHFWSPPRRRSRASSPRRTRTPGTSRSRWQKAS
jgi:hypothetical protein